MTFLECLQETGFDKKEYITELNDTVYDVQACLSNEKSVWLNVPAEIRVFEPRSPWDEREVLIDLSFPRKTFRVLGSPAVALSGAGSMQKIHSYFGNLK